MHPHDVAVYAPGGTKQYVFVTDNGTGNLVRFAQDGNNLQSPLQIDTGVGPHLLEAVAVNDIPGHCNQGQVYVTKVSGPPGPNLLITVYGASDGLPKMDLIPPVDPGFFGPTGQGLACDIQGNVYVTDNIRQRTLRFDAPQFDPSRYGSSWIGVPDAVFDDYSFSSPYDVSIIYRLCSCVTKWRRRRLPPGYDVLCCTDLVHPGSAGIDAAGPKRDAWIPTATSALRIPVGDATNPWSSFHWSHGGCLWVGV